MQQIALFSVRARLAQKQSLRGVLEKKVFLNGMQNSSLLSECVYFQSNPNSVKNWKYPAIVTIFHHNMYVKVFEAILFD